MDGLVNKWEDELMGGWMGEWVMDIYIYMYLYMYVYIHTYNSRNCSMSVNIFLRKKDWLRFSYGILWVAFKYL